MKPAAAKTPAKPKATPAKAAPAKAPTASKKTAPTLAADRGSVTADSQDAA